MAAAIGGDSEADLRPESLLYYLDTICCHIKSENLHSTCVSLVAHQLIPLSVKEELELMHESVPHLRKCRYLMWSVYNTIREVDNGLEKFLRVLCDLPVGRELAVNYYKKIHWYGIISTIIFKFVEPNLYELLKQMYCDGSHSTDSIAHRESNQPELICVDEKDEAFTILIEAQASASTLNNEISMWSKNGEKISETCPLLCVRVADVTAQGTYKYYVDGNTQSVSRVNINCLMDNHHSDLKEKYEHYNISEMDENAWPQVSQNTYINLAVIKPQECQNPSTFTSETIRGDADDIHRVKGEINYKDAFDDINHGEVVIVEGRPGSGKTTLVHKISHDWAKLNAKKHISKGKEKHFNWSHIKALFLIHLRGFCGDPSIELIHLIKLYYSNRKTIKAICDYITLKQGAGICIILDGLDEYQPTNKDNFIFKLIEKTVLRKAVIIVASRPAAVAKYKTTKKHIEVLGFFKEQISEYIDSYNFSLDPAHSKSKLKHYLKERPNVYHMCYLPIQLAMVCFLFTKMEGTLPDTETDIYEAFTKHTILRSLYRNSENTEVFINSIFTMLEPNKHLFTNICALAFDKTLNSKQVLIQSEVELICDEISSAFGLVTIDRAATLCGFQNLYTFSHLTLQEFLAACHIFMVNGTDQLKLIEMSKERKHMVVVLKFLCGLIHFGQHGALFHKIINTEHINCLTKIQCAFESKSPATCNYLVEKNSLSIEGTFLTTRDWTAIGFVFMNTCENCVKKLSLIIPNISEESLEALKIQTKQNSDSLVLESISFSNSIDKIFIKFMRMFSSLSILTTKLNFTIKSMILFFKKNGHPNVTLINFHEHDINKMILKFEFKKMLQGLVFSSVKSLKGSEDQTTCASTLVDVILNSLEPQSEFFVEELREKCLAMCPSGSCAKLSIFDVDSDKSFMVAESFLIDEIASEITYMTARISKLMDDSMLCYIDFIPAGCYVIALSLCLEVTHYDIAGRILIVPADVSPFIENPELINYNVLTIDDSFADKLSNYLEPLLLNNPVFYPNRILKNLHICTSYKMSDPLSCISSIFHLSTTHLKEGSVKKLIDDLFHLGSALTSCTKLKETEVFIYGINHLLSSLITKITEDLGSKESNFTSIKKIKNAIKIEKVTLSTKAIDESSYHLECTSSSMKLSPSYKSISIFVNRQILNLIQFQSDQLPIKIILKFDFARLLNMYTIFSLNNFISKKSKNMDSILVDIILSCCNTKMENFVDELTELCSILCARSSCVRLSLAENVILDEIHMIAEGLNDKYMIREIESILSEILGIENSRRDPSLFYINFIPVNGCLILLHCYITNYETKYGIYILPENFLSIHQNKLEEFGCSMYKPFRNIVQDALKQILKTPVFTSKQKQLHYLSLDIYFKFDYIPLVEIITEIDCHCKLEGNLPAIEQTNPSCINLISFTIPNNYKDYVFCKLLELRFRDELSPMNFPTNYELGINIDDLESLSNALRLCRKLEDNALFDGGEHFIFKLLAGLKQYSDRDCKKIVEVDQVNISGSIRHDYNLIHSSSLVELSCSKINIVSTISIIKYQNMKIFRFKSGPQPIKLIVKFNVSYLLKPLFSSSINFVKGKPESCTSFLANVILSSFNILNDVDELTELCSTMGQQDSCVKLSMMESTISDEIHMLAECMDRTDTIREIELITSSDLHTEYSTRKIPLLHYTDFISVDGYVIIYYFDSTESSVINYVMYIAPAEVINCIDHRVSGNELRLDSGFMSEVHYFMTKLFEDSLISQQQKRLLSLYISNNNSHPYPISQIITHFSTSLKHLELAGDCIAKYDLQELCQVMTSCNNLTSFSISGDEESYASDILASLKSCKQLNQVSLKKCYFSWVPELAASHIGQLNLVRLDLSDNVMSIPFLKKLTKLFKQWKMLQEISLSHCGISGESLAYLVEELMECKQLLALNISHNELGNEGCMKLSEALYRLSQCNNVTLQRLDFSHCDISDKEVKALVDLIKKVSINLEVFDISHNYISSLAALKLFYALQSCINLLELSLEVKDDPAKPQQLFFYNSLKAILVNAVKLHKLSLSGLCFRDTTLFEQIKMLQNLQVLKLTNCRVETDCQFHSFVPESLRVLDLSNNKYTNRTLFYKHLQLHFSYCVHETVFLLYASPII